MQVRDAETRDYESIRDLFHDSDTYHARHAPAIARVPDEPRFKYDEFTALIANTHCLLLVAEAEEDNKIVGFIEASVRVPERSDEPDTRWCGINNLAIDRRWRRQRCGTLLMRAVEEGARAQGITQIRLDVFEFNDAARGLYESLGYRTLTRQLGKSLTDPAEQ